MMRQADSRAQGGLIPVRAVSICQARPKVVPVLTRIRYWVLSLPAVLALSGCFADYDEFTTDVYVDGNDVYVVVRYSEKSTWSESDDYSLLVLSPPLSDTSWERYRLGHAEYRSSGKEEGTLQQIYERISEGDSRQTQACFPEPQGETDSGETPPCFRLGAEPVEVEISYDGGLTWSYEWGLEEYQRKEVAGVEPWSSGSPDQPVSSALAVAPVEGGHIVLVANGSFGLEIRDVDGTWFYTGKPGLNTIYPMDPRIHDRPPEPRNILDPWLFGLVFLPIVSLVSLSVLARNKQKKRDLRHSWPAAAWVAASTALYLYIVYNNRALAFPETIIKPISDIRFWMLGGVLVLATIGVLWLEPPRSNRSAYALIMTGGITGVTWLGFYWGGGWVGLAAGIAATVGFFMALRSIPDAPLQSSPLSVG
jgi:hypothetical protein